MKKKLLIIGTGSIAKRHLKNVKKIAKNQQILIYSKNKTRVKKLINKFDKGVALIKKIDNKIKDNVSHAIIATNTNANTNFLRKIINFPINIYCEKPLVDNSSFDFLKNKYFNSIKSKRVKIGFQFRFNPAIAFLKRELEKKENKNVFLFNFMCGQNLKDWRGEKNHKKFYSAGKKEYSSVFWELCHEIDLVNYLFGLPIKIYSSHVNSKFLKLKAKDISITHLFLKKNLSGQISVEMLSPVLYRKLIIVTLNNHYELDLVNNLIIKRNKYSTKKYKFKDSRNEMFKLYIKNFIENKKKSKNFDYSDLNDGMKVTNIIRAMIKSNKTGKKIIL